MPTSESRKVQKTGTSTITVSLPKRWIDSNNIQPGDSVSISLNEDGSLCIDPLERKKDLPLKSIIEVEEENTEHLGRKLIGAYLAGFNVIEVRSKDRISLDMKHAIKAFSRLVIGPEVIEETSNSIILHDLSDPVELPQKKCVRRMHLLVGAMYRDAISSYLSGDSALSADVIDRDQDIDRLYWMTVKQFNLIQKDRKLAEIVGVNIYDSMSLMLVARAIERIGDHAEKIAKHVNDSGSSKISRSNIDTIKDASEESSVILTLSTESFFARDVDKANDVIDRADALSEKIRQLTIAMPEFPSADVMSILDSIGRVAMYSADIAELAINDAMRCAVIPE